MKTNILPAIKLTVICILFFSGIYTLAVWGIAYFAPNHGEGEVVTLNSKVVGYELIGQKFTQDKYFWARPSAVDYNANGSGGSNKGPSNPDYLKQVQLAIDTFLLRNPAVKRQDVPVEMVTASGSGLDPDISPEAALVQIPRVARARAISEENLKRLVTMHTEKPLLGLFGPPKVNVLKLNISLNNLK